MHTVYSIIINAEPAQIFYWLDNAERVMQWVPNIVENEDIEVTENKIGSTFRQIYVEHGRRMEMRGVVTAYELNKHLACEISGQSFDLLVDYKLEDLAGQTRLTQDATIRFKGFFGKIIGILASPFIKKSSMKQLEASFAKLKALSEDA